MHTKKRKIIVSILILVAIIVFLSTFVRSAFYSPDDEVEATPELAAIEKAQKNLTGHSARLQIPELSIDARVQEVGISKKGTVGTPNNFSDVGWYKYGPLPGKPGTAIIDGHVDNGLALPGVFKKLHTISVGDDVYIITIEGKKLHFVVKKIATYDYDTPTNQIFAKTDTASLILITCTGNWVQDIRTHDKRLVVTTELAS